MVRQWETFKEHFIIEKLPIVGNLEDVVDWYFEQKPPFSNIRMRLSSVRWSIITRSTKQISIGRWQTCSIRRFKKQSVTNFIKSGWKSKALPITEAIRMSKASPGVFFYHRPNNFRPYLLPSQRRTNKKSGPYLRSPTPTEDEHKFYVGINKAQQRGKLHVLLRPC